MRLLSHLSKTINRAVGRRMLTLALVLALATAYPFFAANTRRTLYTVEIELAANTEATARLFGDFGKGFKEEHSVRRPVAVSDHPVAVRFPIACGNLVRLRLDPMDVPGTGSLGQIRVLDENGKPLLHAAPRVEIERNLQIIPDAASPAITHFVATTRDPQLFATFAAPISLPERGELSHRTISALPIFIAVLAGTLLVTACIRGYPETIPGMDKCTYIEKRWFIAGLLFAGLKLWLVSGQTLYALVDAQHDDALFVTLSNHILGGRWLGPYSEFTLMKGPMYSLFIAGVFLAGSSLLVAQHLLYIVGCVLLVRALRPLGISQWLLFSLFLLLLFNPITYDAGAHTRVLRQNISDALVLVIVSSGIALYLRRRLHPGKLLPWALAGGAALPAFWLTREDSVWLMPVLTLLWGALLVALWRDRQQPAWRFRLVITLLPLLLWAAGLGAVAWLNYLHYGVFTTCEMKHPSFKAAYGALLRIDAPDRKKYVSITGQTREFAYSISPSFAQLRRFIERTHDGPPVPPGTRATREIEDAYFVWTLRTAVFESGNANNGAEAMAFYERMAGEINAACDKGLVPAGSKRSGFFPPWKSNYLRPLVETLRRSAIFFVSFDDLSVGPQPSLGSAEGFVRFEDITRCRLTPPSGYPPIPRQQRWLDSFRRAVLKTIQEGYHGAGMPVAGVSLLAFFASLIVSICRRRLPFTVLLGAGLFLSCAAIVTICSLIETLSFRAVFTMYFTAAYGLWLLFIATSWFGLVEAFRKPSSPSTTPAPGINAPL